MRTWRILVAYGRYKSVETTDIPEHEISNRVLLLDETYYNRYEADMEVWRLNYINNNDQKALEKLKNFKETHPEYWL